nr:MAG TPA: Baseplate wedge protein [Bacteriophage sp.]
MQDYTPLGSTATTTVKEGILNHEKNINALRSTYSGTAFPTENLVAGLKCYRTDLGKTYTYNGEAWDDSVSTASLTVSGETSVPTPSTTNNSKTIANTEFVHGVVSKLVNGAPTALDTLQELATALGNDPNFSTTILNKIGEKESKADAQIEHKRLQDAIPTKVSQLSNDSGYQKTAEIPVASQTQNGYMSKYDKAKLDSLSLDSYVLKTELGNYALKTDLSGKLDKTGTAAAAIKATQDGAGNVIATTYIKTVNNLKPDSDGNVNISGGTGGNITVDSVLSPTSTNAIQNRVVQQEFTSMRATIPTKVSQLTNDSGYLTQHQSLDGYVKTVNNTAPDSNGNVTIALSGGGGVSTSESNTWTGKQTFQKMKFNFESYNAPRISGAIDNPSESVAVYNVQGDFTLDMSELAGLLSNGDATVFTAYITANGSYTLSITNAGTLKYAGSATDLAITAKGLLLNIMLIKSSTGVLLSVAQASTLS